MNIGRIGRISLSKGFIILLLVGCTWYDTRIECQVVADFFYNNKTPYTIKGVLLQTDNGLRTDPILPYEKIEIRREGLRSFCQVDHTNYVPPISMADSTRIIFEDRKFLIYGFESAFCGEGFMGIGNYSYRKISERYFEFTYTFTEEDYNNATPLVFGEGFVGSVWRCTEGEGVQEGLLYNELRFISDTEVEGWVQAEGEALPEFYFTVGYSI